jgi:uncharacterized protein (TIGR04255 family)
MDADSPMPLPEFNKPPVVETVLGIQFDLLPTFTNAHLGAFWQSLGEDWPSVSDAPATGPDYERFGEDQIWARIGFQFRLEQVPPARIQIRNKSNDRMIQIQNGRLHYNWLGRNGSEYARYQTINEEFAGVVEKLTAFVQKLKLGELRTNQWEVTYVNHLPKNSLWTGPASWNEIFASPVALPYQINRSKLESFSGQWHYAIGDNEGRLHVEILHGREELTVAPPAELLIFKLTARGPIPKTGGWNAGLEIGHRAIVESFKDLTSDAARNFWEEKA